MRIALVQMMVAMVFSGMAIAFDTHAQEILKKKVSLHLKEVSLVEALTEIETATNIRFVYSPNRLKLEEKVTVDVHGKKLGSLLDDLLKPRSITYKVQDGGGAQEGGEYIVLIEQKLGPVPSFSKELSGDVLKPHFYRISGRVTDKAGLPLPGVNILVRGTATGTSTDADGQYVIEANDNDWLIFSFIGYKTYETHVNGRAVIEVVLEEEITALNEVVVVGYGTQERKDVTGSISSINLSQAEGVPFRSVDQVLQGRSAGVFYVQNSGMPGAGASVRIRGGNSINGVTNPFM